MNKRELTNLTPNLIETQNTQVCGNCSGKGYIEYYDLPMCDGATLYHWIKAKHRVCHCQEDKK